MSEEQDQEEEDYNFENEDTIEEEPEKEYDQVKLPVDFQYIVFSDLKKKSQISKKQVYADKGGEDIKKYKDASLDIGDYLVINRESGLAHNLSYAIKNDLRWNPKSIVGYVSGDTENYDNQGKDTIKMIKMMSSSSS